MIRLTGFRQWIGHSTWTGGGDHALGGLPRRREEGEVDAGERLRVRLLDLDLPLADGQAATGGAVGGEKTQPLEGESPLQGDLEELLADEAGGADDGYGVGLGHPP